MDVKLFAQGHLILHSVPKTSLLSLDSKALIVKLGFEGFQARKYVWHTKEHHNPENQPSLSHS